MWQHSKNFFFFIYTKIKFEIELWMSVFSEFFFLPNIVCEVKFHIYYYPLCMQTNIQFILYITHSLLFHFRIHNHWIIFRIVFAPQCLVKKKELYTREALTWRSKTKQHQRQQQRKIQLYLLLLSTECKNIIEWIPRIYRNA